MKLLTLQLLSFLIFIDYNSYGQISNIPDTLFKKTNVELKVNLNNNKISEILHYKDTVVVSKQIFINGRLSSIYIYDDKGIIKEINYLFRNKRISETREYKNGILSKKLIFKRNGKIDVIYIYNGDKLINYVLYGRDGQPIK